MRAEVVSIGSGLVLGPIVDTNAAFIVRHLAVSGLHLFHEVTVGDNPGRAAASLAAALERADVVIATGGLGPTLTMSPGRLRPRPPVGRWSWSRSGSRRSRRSFGLARIRPGGGPVAELAEALRIWGTSDLASATAIDPPDGDVFPTRIGVATAQRRGCPPPGAP